jgi:hypothetical protein
VQAFRGADEIASCRNSQKGAGEFDVHEVALIYSIIRY